MSNFETTTIFLKEALVSGAHLQKPVGIKILDDNWTRRRNMVGIYCGSQATLGDIAIMYGYVRPERPRQIIKETIIYLWESCSADIQQMFPLEALSFRKPFLLRSRQRYSQAHGGISIQLSELVREGKTAEEIIKFGFSEGQLSSSRKTLREWGIEIPYPSYKKVATVRAP